MLGLILGVELTAEPRTQRDPSILWFAQRTAPLRGRPGLFHGPKGPLFIGIVEPAAFPEVAGKNVRRNFGAALFMERDPVDGSSDMNPINHGHQSAIGKGSGVGSAPEQVRGNSSLIPPDNQFTEGESIRLFQ